MTKLSVVWRTWATAANLFQSLFQIDHVPGPKSGFTQLHGCSIQIHAEWNTNNYYSDRNKFVEILFCVTCILRLYMYIIFYRSRYSTLALWLPLFQIYCTKYFFINTTIMIASYKTKTIKKCNIYSKTILKTDAKCTAILNIRKLFNKLPYW